MQYQYWAPGGFTQHNHSYNVSAIIFHSSTTRRILSKSISDIAHFNIQLCNIDVTLVTGSTAVFVQTGPQLFHQRKSNLKPTHSDRCPCDAASIVGSKCFWACRCLVFFSPSDRLLLLCIQPKYKPTDFCVCLLRSRSADSQSQTLQSDPAAVVQGSVTGSDVASRTLKA